MTTYQIPGVGELTLDTIILDLNGTITVGGKVVPGLKERIGQLKEQGYHFVLLSGNTRGDARKVAQDLDIELHEAHDAAAKVQAAREFDAEGLVAVGNGLIDSELFKASTLSIAVLQAEGAHVKTLMAADMVVPTVNDALDLLIDSQRLIAGLRK